MSTVSGGSGIRGCLLLVVAAVSDRCLLLVVAAVSDGCLLLVVAAVSDGCLLLVGSGIRWMSTVSGVNLQKTNILSG